MRWVFNSYRVGIHTEATTSVIIPTADAATLTYALPPAHTKILSLHGHKLSVDTERF